MAQRNSTGRQSGFRIPRDPAILLVDLLLIAIIIFFIGITYGYIARLGDTWQDFRLPKIFWLSTMCILLVSYFLRRLLAAFDKDDTAELQRRIFSALLAALGFTACQVTGWIQLRNSGILPDTAVSASYVYVLSGLHVLHVVVGLVFLLVAAIRIHNNTGSGLKSLIYYSDAVPRRRLLLMTHYWHAIDLIWLVLFLAFLFNHT